MPDYLLWKRLTLTDFNAVNGKAAPSGGGGGAMHVALGVATPQLDVERFLGRSYPKSQEVAQTIQTAGGKPIAGALVFRRDPNRRNGEWRIADQFAHRHPVWSEAAGFPPTYDPGNPPYVLVFRIGRAFHARLSSLERITSLASQLPLDLSSREKGVVVVDAAVLALFKVSYNPSLGLLRTLEEQAEADDDQRNALDDDDDELDADDARKRVMAELVRRQGQPAFRRELLKAYGERCAVTGDAVRHVLEAAHIVPYRGPKSNKVTNGLLLRSDVHTLFDLHLVAIDPSSLTILVSALLDGTPYADLAGRTLRLPARKAARPSPKALLAHFRGLATE